MAATGTLHELFPYVRFGTGPEPLVVLPGMAFDNPPPGTGRARAYAWSMHRLAAGRTVTVLQRPRGLAAALPDHPGPPAPDTTDLADLHAPVLRDELGPARVAARHLGDA